VLECVPAQPLVVAKENERGHAPQIIPDSCACNARDQSPENCGQPGTTLVGTQRRSPRRRRASLCAQVRLCAGPRAAVAPRPRAVPHGLSPSRCGGIGGDGDHGADVATCPGRTVPTVRSAHVARCADGENTPFGRSGSPTGVRAWRDEFSTVRPVTVRSAAVWRAPATNEDRDRFLPRVQHPLDSDLRTERWDLGGLLHSMWRRAPSAA